MVKFKKEKLKEDYVKVKKGLGSIWGTVKSDRAKIAKWQEEGRKKKLSRIKEEQKILREKAKLERERMKLRKMRGSRSGGGDMFGGMF